MRDYYAKNQSPVSLRHRGQTSRSKRKRNLNAK
jgi:hypothetical protein